MHTKKQPTAIDLFSGAGGLSYGFEQAGYKLLAAVDNNKDANLTYEQNFPETKLYRGKLEDIDPQAVMEDLNLRPGDLDCLIGGPPCQGFSAKGNMALRDPRNKLFAYFLNFASSLKPKIVLIENVPPILTLGNNKFKNEICKLFNNSGYDTVYKNLIATDYGVPQIRRRAFFIASSNHKNPLFPKPTHAPKRRSKKLGLLPYITIKEAIGDLPILRPGGKCERYVRVPHSTYQKRMRSGQAMLHNHEAKVQNETNMSRIKHLKQGQSMVHLPKDLQAKSGFSQAYGRLSNNKQAHTITANMHNLGSGRYIHSTQNRSITVREAARLQSFDDKFIFYGSPYSQCRQVGNAVPPLLTRAIAEKIKEDFFNEEEKIESSHEIASNVV